MHPCGEKAVLGEASWPLQEKGKQEEGYRGGTCEVIPLTVIGPVCYSFRGAHFI